MSKKAYEIMIIRNLLITILALVVAIAIMMLFNTGDNLNKPDYISVDSVRQMTCDELRVNFNLCRRSTNSESWGYCAEVYLPLYYGKCQESCVDKMMHNFYYNAKLVPEFNEDIGDTTFEEFQEDIYREEEGAGSMLTAIKLMCGEY